MFMEKNKLKCFIVIIIMCHLTYIFYEFNTIKILPGCCLSGSWVAVQISKTRQTPSCSSSEVNVRYYVWRWIKYNGDCISINRKFLYFHGNYDVFYSLKICFVSFYHTLVYLFTSIMNKRKIPSAVPRINKKTFNKWKCHTCWNLINFECLILKWHPIKI